jgi:hypothetical protein
VPATRSRHATCTYSCRSPPSQSHRSGRMAALEPGEVSPVGAVVGGGVVGVNAADDLRDHCRPGNRPPSACRALIPPILLRSLSVPPAVPPAGFEPALPPPETGRSRDRGRLLASYLGFLFAFCVSVCHTYAAVRSTRHSTGSVLTGRVRGLPCSAMSIRRLRDAQPLTVTTRLRGACLNQGPDLAERDRECGKVEPAAVDYVSEQA